MLFTDSPQQTVCFPKPVTTSAMDAYRRRVPRMAVEPAILQSADILRGLSDESATALGKVLPGLLCGEESAVHAFHNEGERVSRSVAVGANQALFQIAAEEEYHEQLLSSLAAQLPVVMNLTERRQQGRRYFRRLLSRDSSQHFARIAALDSAVCIILSRLHQADGPIPRDSIASRIISRIRRDEGRHVAFSRRYAAALGASRQVSVASFELVRVGLVDLLRCCGEAFDTLKVDPDRLFNRLLAKPPDLF